MRPVVLLVLLLLVVAAPPPGAASEEAWVDPDLDGLADGPVRVIVQTDRPVDPALGRLLGLAGTVETVLRVIDGAIVLTTVAQVPTLARVDGVLRIDADEPLAWHLDTSRPSVHVGPPIWTQGFDGAGTTVAVVDTGVDGLHPGLSDRLLAGVVFTDSGGTRLAVDAPTDRDGHGTHVAGIVAGSGSGSTLLDSGDLRYSGLAIGASIVGLDISQAFSTATAIRAFDWIHDNHERYGITVVQNSWGREQVGETFDPDDSVVLASDALVRDDGLLLVFSAANQGPGPSTLSMEAQNPNVLTVGAVDDAGRVASFSSRGPVLLADGTPAAWTKPDVVAPGVRIMSAAALARGGDVADTGTIYRELSGTSQAAPHVAGMAAVIRARVPGLGPLEIMELLRSTARDVGAPGPDTDTGFGFVDMTAALPAALGARPDASGAMVFPVDETFTTSGRLSVGGVAVPLRALRGATSQDHGVASGTVPVKDDALTLSIHIVWTPDTIADPALTARVLDPAGTAVPMSMGDHEAVFDIDLPAAGNWTWRLEATDALQAGVVDYEATGTVTLAVPLTITGTSGGSGGFFDDSLAGRAERLADAVGGPMVLALVAAVAGVLLVAAVVLRRL